MSTQGISDTGIILRTRPLTETSLIAQWITVEHGRLSTVARGARRITSPFRGKLDLFYRARFSFVRSRRSDLHTLTELVLEETYAGLREDMDRLHQAGYMAALVEQNTETETPIPEVYRLVDAFLEAIHRRRARSLEVYAFEMKFLNLLGLTPLGEASNLPAGTREILRCLDEQSFKQLEKLRVSPKQSMEVRQYLHGFLIYHLGKLAPGRIRAVNLT